MAGASAATVTRLTVELNIEVSWRDTGGRDIFGNRPQGSLVTSFYLDNPSSAAGTFLAANGWTWQPVPGGVPTMSGTNNGGRGHWVLSTPEAMRFVDLAPAVSFTSDSGVFLTAAVPEPQTWAMLLGGLGVLGSVARRRASVAQ